MRIYLCSRFGRRNELHQHEKTLVELGHWVTSSWLYVEESTGCRTTKRAEYGQRDVEDLELADCLIAFTESPDSTDGKRGGRHVELGMALALKKRVVVIGHRENIFCCLPQVEFHETFEEMLASWKT